MSRSSWISHMMPVVGAVVIVCLTAGCPPPPPPGYHVTVHAEGPEVLLPPPPPFLLPPAPVVVYSDAARCEYVAGVDYDVFYIDGCFYTHHNHRWFCVPRPGAAWVVVPPAYVPPLLVPGPPPPGWNRAPAGPKRSVTSFRGEVPFPVPAQAKSVTTPAEGRRPPSGTSRPSSPGQIERPVSGRVPQPAAPGGVKPAQPPNVERPTPPAGKPPVTPGSEVSPPKPTPKPPQPPASPARPKPGRSPGKGRR